MPRAVHHVYLASDRSRGSARSAPPHGTFARTRSGRSDDHVMSLLYPCIDVTCQMSHALECSFMRQAHV